MNSREKQRKATRASNGLVAKVRQLPIYMKVINIILAIVLIFGVGADWAHAAELIPEATYTTQDVSLNTDGEQTLYAPSVENASSYDWCVYSGEVDSYLPIGGEGAETGSSLNITSAMVKSVLDSKNKATVRCNVYSDSGETLATKDYFVAVQQTTVSTNNDVTSSLNQNLSDLFPGVTTTYLEGNVDNENSKLNETNDGLTVTIKFYDNTDAHSPLGYQIEHQFQSNTPFSWFAKLNSDTGKIAAVESVPKFSDEDVFKCTTESPDGFTTGVSVVSTKGVPSDVANIEVKAYYDIKSYFYTLDMYYENLDGSYSNFTQRNEAALTTSVPTDNDMTWMTEQYQGKGWEVASYQTDVVKNINQPTVSQPDAPGVIVTIVLNRTFTIVKFDLDKGSNGPSAVYLKNGSSFGDVKAWKTSSGVVYPTPTPEKNSHTFLGWKDQEGEMMPTDWTNVPVPGVTGSKGTASDIDYTYTASWRFDATDIIITITYWTESADTTLDSEGKITRKYEYAAERYDKVTTSDLGKTYILPGSDKGWSAYSKSNATTDRRFPQERQSGQQFVQKGDDTEIVPTADGFLRYDDLFHFNHATTTVIDTDGSSVVNVYLDRNIYRVVYKKSKDATGDDVKYIFGKWDQQIFQQKPAQGDYIYDPRYVGELGSKHTQKGSNDLYVEWNLGQQWHIDINDNAHSVCLIDMPYSRPSGWSTHTPSSTEPSDMYWGSIGYYKETDAKTQVDLHYYLQKVDTYSTKFPFKHKANQIKGNKRETLFENPSDWWGSTYTSDSVREPLIRMTLAEADKKTQTLYNSDGKPSDWANYTETNYSNNFIETATLHMNKNNQGQFVSGYVNIIGFKTPENGSWENAPLKNAAVNTDFSLFYERNRNPLYLRNISKVADTDWHYDSALIIDNAVPFEMKWNDISFKYGDWKTLNKEDENRWSTTGTPDGGTGIIQGQKLSGLTTENYVKVPEKTTDTHFVFKGWYLDEAGTEPIDTNTWTMPNHEQDIWAVWTPPERKLQYHDSEDKPVGSVVETTYSKQIPLEKQPGQWSGVDDPENVEIPGKRFVSWYYYDNNDPSTGTKMYFNPKTMDMPFVGKDGDDTVINLYQEWINDDVVNYVVHYKLKDGDNEVQIADDTRGRANAWTDAAHSSKTTIDFDVTNKPTTDFYQNYRGVVECISPEGNPGKYTMTLEIDESKNEYTFWYKWDETGYYVKVDYYISIQAGAEDQFYKTAIEWTNESTSETPGLTKESKHSATASYEAPDLAGLTLKSAKVQTISLRSDTEKEEGDLEDHPTQNIIKVYYEEGAKTKFHYSTAVCKGLNDYTLDNKFTGGKVDPTYEEVYPVSGLSQSWAYGYKGFQIVGWVDADKLAAKITSDDIILPVYDEEKMAYRLDAPKDDENETMYTKSEYKYCALFTYGGMTDIPIQYKVKVLDGAGRDITDKSNNAVSLSRYKDNAKGPLNIVDGTATKLSDVNVTVNNNLYKYVGWYDNDNNPVSGQPSTGTPFTVPTETFTDSSVQPEVEYWYYEANTYTVVFRENGGNTIDLTYAVATDSSGFGKVAVNNTLSIYDASVTESVYPIIGNPEAGGSIDNPNIYAGIAKASQGYRFKGWSVDNDSTIKYTNATLPPLDIREGSDSNKFWAVHTYYAHFELDDVVIHFTSENTGTIDPNLSDITVKSGTTFSIDGNNGKMEFYNPYDEAKYTDNKIPKPYAGYKIASSPWVTLNGDTEEGLPAGNRITKETTFKAKFTEGDAVVLTYQVASSDSAHGYFYSYGTEQPSATETVMPITGEAKGKEVSARLGYTFDYWTLDSETEGEHYTTNPWPIPKDTDDLAGHQYYKAHTAYAHFKTYDCNVQFVVADQYKNIGVINYDGGDAPWTVQSNTTYAVNEQASSDKRGTIIINFNNSDHMAIPKEKAGAFGYEFDYWTVKVGSSSSEESIPEDTTKRIISPTQNDADVTFTAYFKQTGDSYYKIESYFETVEHAKGTAGATDYVKDETLSPDTISSAAGESIVSFQYKNFEGFTGDHAVGNPAITSSGWRIASNVSKQDAEQGKNNVLKLYYNRDKEYPYAYDTYVMGGTYVDEHAKKGDITQSQYSGDQNEYERTYRVVLDENNQPLKGIYGDVVKVPYNKWHSQEIIPVLADHKYQTPDPTDDHFWYRIGDKPTETNYETKGTEHLGLINVFHNRPFSYSYQVWYYKQNSSGGYDAPIKVVNDKSSPYYGHGKEFVAASNKTIDIINPDTKQFNNVKWDITSWKDTPDGQSLTYQQLFSGYTLSGFNPATGSIENDSYNYPSADGQAVFEVRFDRNLNTHYKVNYWAETPESAQARLDDPTKEPVYFETPSAVDEFDNGVTDTYVDITGDSFKTKLPGYTYVSPSSSWLKKSDAEVLVKGYVDEKDMATANIYFTANTNTQFKVEYYKENMEGTQYDIDTLMTSWFTGITGSGLHICDKTVHPQQEKGCSGEFRADISGFKYNVSKTLSENGNVDPVKLTSSPSVTLKLYYSRNTDVPYVIKYYQQELSSQTQTPIQSYKHVESDDINGVGKTDELVDFTEQISDNKYYGFNYSKHTINNKPTTNKTFNILGDGTSEVNIYYDLIKVPYTIEYWTQNIKADGTLDDTYSMHSDTSNLTDWYGKQITMQPISIPGFGGQIEYKPSQKIIVGTIYSYKDTTYDHTVGRIYYSRDTSKYSLIYKLETLASAKSGTHNEFDVQSSVNFANTGSKVSVEDHKKDFPGFTLNSIDPTTETVVSGDGTTSITYTYYRQKVSFKFNYYQETLTYAKTGQGDQFNLKDTYVAASDEEKMFVDDVISTLAEAKDPAGSTEDNKLGNKYAGFTYKNAFPDSSLRITADGNATANIYYARNRTNTYTLYYYVEKLTWTSEVDKYESFPDIAGEPPIEVTVTNAVTGDIINSNTVGVIQTRPGYKFAQCSIYDTKAGTQDEEDFIEIKPDVENKLYVQYDRNTNQEYTLNYLTRIGTTGEYNTYKTVTMYGKTGVTVPADPASPEDDVVIDIPGYAFEKCVDSSDSTKNYITIQGDKICCLNVLYNPNNNIPYSVVIQTQNLNSDGTVADTFSDFKTIDKEGTTDSTIDSTEYQNLEELTKAGFKFDSTAKEKRGIDAGDENEYLKYVQGDEISPTVEGQTWKPYFTDSIKLTPNEKHTLYVQYLRNTDVMFNVVYQKQTLDSALAGTYAYETFNPTYPTDSYVWKGINGATVDQAYIDGNNNSVVLPDNIIPEGFKYRQCTNAPGDISPTAKTFITIDPTVEGGATIYVLYDRLTIKPALKVTYMGQSASKYGTDEYDINLLGDDKYIEFSAVYEQTISENTRLVDVADNLLKDVKQNFTGYTYAKAAPTWGFNITINERDLIIYYKVNKIPDTQPAIQVKYMGQSLQNAKDIASGASTQPLYTETLGTANLSAIYSDSISDDPESESKYFKNWTSPDNIKLFKDDFTGYDFAGTYTGLPVEKITTQTVTIVLNYNREYYCPPDPDPDPEPETYGFKVVYKGQTVDEARSDAKTYSETLGTKYFDAVYGETIDDPYYQTQAQKKDSKWGNSIMQNFAGFVFNNTYINIPVTITAKNSTVIELYYDRDYYNPPPGPDPEPDPENDYGFTVKYLGQSFDQATQTVGEYTVQLSEDVYFDAIYGENINSKDFVTKAGKKIYKDFTGYTYNHCSATAVNPLVIGVNPLLKDNVVTIYYNLNYFDPPTTAAFTAHYMLQTLDSAVSGSNAVYEEKESFNFDGYFNEQVTDVNWVSEKKEPLKKDYTNIGYEFHHVREGDLPLTIKGNGQEVFLYYNLEKYTTAFSARYYKQKADEDGNPIDNSYEEVTGDAQVFAGYYGQNVKLNFVSVDNKKLLRSYKGYEFIPEKTMYTKSDGSTIEFPDDGINIDETHKQVINLYYDIDYYPDNPDPDDPSDHFAFKAVYKFQDPATSGQETAKYIDNESYPSKQFDGYWNQKVVVGSYYTDECGNLLPSGLPEGYKYVRATLDDNIIDSGLKTGFFRIDDTGKQVVTLYFDCEYYNPDPDPNIYAFKTKYMLQDVDSTGTPKDSYTEVKDMAQTLDGYFGQNVTANYVSKAGEKIGLNYYNPDGYTLNKSDYYDGSTTVAFTSFYINAAHNQVVTFYFNVDYYDPDDPDPSQHAAFTAIHMIEKLENNMPSGKYDTFLTERFDGYHNQEVKNGWESEKKHKFGPITTEANYTFDHAVGPEGQEWTDDSTFKIDDTGKQVVTFYYNLTYYPDDPDDPTQSGFTVYYKGLSLDAAKKRETEGYAPQESDYTENLSNNNVSNGVHAFGAYATQEITLDYEFEDCTVAQTFKGFNYNNTFSESTKPFPHIIDGAGWTVTLYYDRTYYDPDPDDPKPEYVEDKVGYTVNHYVQNLDYLLYGEGPEYVIYENDDYPTIDHKAIYKYPALYGESFDKNDEGLKASQDEFMNFCKLTEDTYGFTLEKIECFPNEKADSFTVDKGDTYGFNVYYSRNTDVRAQYKVIKMVKNVDYILGNSSEEYIQYGEPTLKNAYFEETYVSADRVKDLWTEIPEYYFEGRTTPDWINPWEGVDPKPVLLKLNASEHEIPEISGYYDLVNYPSPNNNNNAITAQTGDKILYGVLFGLVGVAILGLYIALKRRNKKNNM